jgi:hypothetical protein
MRYEIVYFDRAFAHPTDSSAYDTLIRISVNHSGASTMTSCPAVVVSNVRQVLSALAFGERFVERRLRICRRADVGFLRHFLACAGELDRLQCDAVRLRRELGIDPGLVFGIDAECGRRRCDAAGLALGDRDRGAAVDKWDNFPGGRWAR